MIVPPNVTHSNTQRNIPLYAPGITKPFAFVNPNLKLLYKTVDGRRHFVRIPPGIAFDDDILRQAGNLGAVDIAVSDSEERAIYRCSLDTFLRHCLLYKRPSRRPPLSTIGPDRSAAGACRSTKRA